MTVIIYLGTIFSFWGNLYDEQIYDVYVKRGGLDWAGLFLV